MQRKINAAQTTATQKRLCKTQQVLQCVRSRFLSLFVCNQQRRVFFSSVALVGLVPLTCPFIQKPKKAAHSSAAQTDLRTEKTANCQITRKMNLKRICKCKTLKIMLIWSLLVFLEKKTFSNISYLFVLWLCLKSCCPGPVSCCARNFRSIKQKDEIKWMRSRNNLG